MPASMDETRELLEARICPRCHRPFSYITVKHGYVYAVHNVKEDGKWRKKYCYLGPEHSYKYVTRLHEDEGLELYGLRVKDRILLYMKNIARYIEHNAHEIALNADAETIESVIETLRKTADALESMLQKQRKVPEAKV